MVDLGQDREPASTQLGNPGASGSEDLVLRAQARVGSTLRGKWHLDTLIGLGGSAAVYAATHRNGSRAAVKVLHPELALVPWVRHRFLREGYVANAVGHPAVVKVLDDDIAEDGAPYLVTELLEGEVLEERRLRLGGRIPQGDVLSIADELLDVLAAAHAQGVVHRDIKPENVFVTRSGRIKVLDFGIARLRDAPADANRTQAGLTMGTPAYMAPEQALGRWDEVDGLSDIWAVGATMFQLLAGRDVHAGATVNEQLLSAMTKPAPALSSAASDVSPEVANLVDRALAFDKGDRWPDARAMQLELRRVSSARSGQAPLPALAVADGHRASRSESPKRQLGRGRLSSIPAVVRARSILAPQPRTRSWRPVGFVATALALGMAAGAAPQLVAGDVVADEAAYEHNRGAQASASPTTVAPPIPSTREPSRQPDVAATDAGIVRSAARPPSPPTPQSPQTPQSLPANAPTTNPAAARSATLKPHVSAQPRPQPTASGADCDPPWVADPKSGKKVWKLQCL